MVILGGTEDNPVPMYKCEFCRAHSESAKIRPSGEIICDSCFVRYYPQDARRADLIPYKDGSKYSEANK